MNEKEPTARKGMKTSGLCSEDTVLVDWEPGATEACWNPADGPQQLHPRPVQALEEVHSLIFIPMLRDLMSCKLAAKQIFSHKYHNTR